jgi:hypothetical protein
MLNWYFSKEKLEMMAFSNKISGLSFSQQENPANPAGNYHAIVPFTGMTV